MSFTPSPVPPPAEVSALDKERHVGYRLMDEFFTANEREPKAVEAFILFLDGVVKNIVDHPEEDKYRKLKKSSKSFAAVGRAKGGARLMDYLGFRDAVEEFEQWAILRTSVDGWLQEFREKATLIRKEYEKHVNAEAVEARSGEAKAASDEAYKKQLLDRIHEERRERKPSHGNSNNAL